MRNERRDVESERRVRVERERCVIHIKIVARHLTAPLMETHADESRVSAQNGGSAMAADSPGNRCAKLRSTRDSSINVDVSEFPFSLAVR